MHTSMNLKNVTSYVKRNDTLDAYLSEINKIPLMTTMEEKDAFACLNTSKDRLNRAKSDYENNLISNNEYNNIRKKEINIQDKIKKEIAERNQRFVFAVAKRYNNGDILSDLVSVGTIGLYEALDSYNWESGTKFTSFAIWYIRRSILAYLNKENYMVRKPGSFSIHTKVKKIENDFFLKNGRKPTSIEIMDILKNDYNIKLNNDTDLYSAQMEYIDSAVSDDDSDYTFENSPEFAVATASTNSFEKKIDEEKLSLTLRNALSALNDRDKKIILMSYGLLDGKEYTNEEIGDMLGICKERVRQIKNSAIKKMSMAMAQTKGSF